MLPLARTIAFLIFIILLSGCLGGDTPTPANATTEQQFAAPASFSEDTGALEGLVTDDSFMPLADVDVGLDDLAQTTITDIEGRFTFSDLAPGAHSIFFSKPGYEGSPKKIDVLAGQALRLTFHLKPLASPQPYHKTVQQSGEIGCDVTVGAAVYRQSGLHYNCGTPSSGNQGPNQRNYQADLNQSSGAWAETSWRATQTTGRSMYIVWTCCGDLMFTSSVVSASPAQERLPITLWQDEGGVFKHKADAGFVLAGVHQAAPDYLGASYPADAALMINQKFDDYVTFFYNAPLPESFSAVPAQ